MQAPVSVNVRAIGDGTSDAVARGDSTAGLCAVESFVASSLANATRGMVRTRE